MSAELDHLRNPKESRLPSDHSLLLPNPGFLPGAAFNKTRDQMGKPNATYSELDHDLFRENCDMLYGEYISILSVLTKHLGSSNITIIKNKMTMGFKNSKTGDLSLVDQDLPEISEFKNIRINSFIDYPSVWTRDGFTSIGPITFLHPLYFLYAQESERVIKSVLGEGGAVLNAGKAVLVSESLWRRRTQDKGCQILKDLGFVVAPLPPVDPSKQGYKFNEDHIDGHAALILDKNGRLRLLITDSYSRQGNGTRKKIRFAAETIGAEIFEIDDRNLPPLVLNFIQFEDRSVVVTEGETRDLTWVLEGMLSNEKVLITDKPIVNIPLSLQGSIRCMTAIVPNSVLKKLETLV